MKHNTGHFLASLIAVSSLLGSGLASAACYTVTRSPTWDGRWVYGADGYSQR